MIPLSGRLKSRRLWSFFFQEIIPSAKKKKEQGISMFLHARRSANERE